MNQFLSLSIRITICLGILLSGISSAIGGGGPENVLVVVNDDSESSRLIANTYISLRGIPDRNVLYLKGIPKKEAMSFEDFEMKVLRPVLAAIEDRKLAGSIDYIVYSADFPTTVRIPKLRKQLIEGLEKAGRKVDTRIYNGEASITSLTYLANRCVSTPWAAMDLSANRYFRIPTNDMLKRPFVGPLQKEFTRSISAFEKSPMDPLYESAMDSLEQMAKMNRGQTAVLYWLARFHAKKGDEKEATRWMTRAVGMGWSDRGRVLTDPDFESITDPVFRGMVKRMGNEGKRDIASRSFRQLYEWGPNGMLNKTKGQGERYFLSTVLAVTRNDGNSEAEAVRQLNRTVAADFTKPNGTFYFANNSDPRTKTRKPRFQVAINALQDLGYRAEIIVEVDQRDKKKKRYPALPQNRDDILGLTAGKSNFDFGASGSRIIPGAICENLTSHGARLGHVGGQTKLNEFLRYGAAGSSGTVVEPYTIPNKFPDPMIHVHYARGCSLAEAFYQSVYGPFQLLIVGDALCQPFATPPKVRVSGIEPMEMVSGTKKLAFDRSSSPVRVAGMELFIDGVMSRRDRKFEEIDFDSTKLTDGYHEIRIVFVAANLMETTGRTVIPMIVNNLNQSCELSAVQTVRGVKDEFSLSFSAEGASKIGIYQHSKLLYEVEAEAGVTTVAAKELGRGKTSLRAIAQFDGKKVSSTPLNLQINGPLNETRPRTAPKPKPKAAKPKTKAA